MAWMHVQVSSEEIRMPASIEVLLPQNAVEQLMPGEKLPVLYLLHDWTGDHSEWMRKTALETFQEEIPMAIVMPSGNASGFVNLKYGKSYQNYIRDELPQICENLFPISWKKEKKYLAGVGMGGYGTLNIALGENCPFSITGAFEADIDMKKHYHEKPEKLEKIFGNYEEYEKSSNCLFHAADNLQEAENSKLPYIVMMCSQSSMVIEENRTLYSAIRKKYSRISMYEDEEASGWRYYGECLYQFMKNIQEQVWQL